MILLAGSTNIHLSERISAETGFHIASVENRVFPDGERYVRINEQLENKDLLFVSSTFPDSSIVELLLLHDAASRMRPSSMRLLIPYFGYQRQDKLFREGEAVSAEIMASLLDSRFDEVMTVDIHADGVLKYFKHSRSVNFVAAPEIARYFMGKGVDLVISPDGGMRAVEYAKEAASVLNCEYDYFLKERIDASTVKLYPKKMDVRGRNVLVLDDIIATGGSMIAALKRLREMGAAKVFVGCTHGLFIGNSLKTISSIAEETVSTDTIETQASAVSVSPIVSHHLMGLR